MGCVDGSFNRISNHDFTADKNRNLRVRVYRWDNDRKCFYPAGGCMTLNTEFVQYLLSGVSYGFSFGAGIYLVGYAVRYCYKTFIEISK